MSADVIQGSFSAQAVRRLSGAQGGAGSALPRRTAHGALAAQAATRQSGAAAHAKAWPVSAAVPIGRRPGERLPQPVQRQMERLLGASFADVQVHTGPEAAALGAEAFTRGSHLYFAPGRYAPHTPTGQRLLAHELTHVVQQRAGRVRNPFGRGVAVVHDPALEAEAERNGLRALSQPPAPPSPPPAARARAAVRQPPPPAAGGCGCGCSSRAAPAACPGTGARRAVQRAATRKSGGLDWRSKPIRKNPGRGATPSKLKRLTRRQQVNLFGSATDTSKQKPCQGLTTPAKAGWRRTMWDGNTRLPWVAPAGQIAPGTVCAWPAGCANLATQVDHIQPFRTYIGNCGATQTFCDGVCHFHGVSMAEASRCYNDPPNLRPLCAAHNAAKAAADRRNPDNVPSPPTPVGSCPNPGTCPACGGICL